MASPQIFLKDPNQLILFYEFQKIDANDLVKKKLSCCEEVGLRMYQYLMENIESDRKQYPNTFKQIESHIQDISTKTL